MEETPENIMIILFVLGVAIMLLLSLSFILFFNYSQKKILAEKAHSQERDLEHQKELLHSVITTQEKVRERIAKDLHDDIGSKLNVIKLNMHQLKKLSKGENKMSESIEEVNHLLSDTIRTTRKISHELLPPTLDKFGLVEALQELKEGINFSKKDFLEVEVIDEMNQRLDKATALHIFRIIQELVTNSIKNAEANALHLFLKLNKDYIKLDYKDDGKGLDLSDQQYLKGLGFKNIKSRLSLLGAQIKYESSPGKGFHAFFTLNQKTNE